MNIYEIMVESLRIKLREGGIPVDKYDPDYIVSSLMEWLGNHQLTLTGEGLMGLGRNLGEDEIVVYSLEGMDGEESLIS